MKQYMNNILILYKSKYGATFKYAEMLREALACDVFQIENFNFSTVDTYHFILLAGGIYARGISCIKYIRKNIKLLEKKPMAILAVGASPFDPKSFEDLKNINLKNLPSDIPIFYARGAYDEQHMSFKDRTLCKLLRKSLAKKDPSSFEPWMTALLEADGRSSDWTDYKYIEPLLEYIKSL